MLKIENAVVAAMAAMDSVTALSLLSDLIVLDRRRGWWAAFRVAAQQPDDRREAVIALVGKAYIARRMGRLVGVPEADVLCALLTLTTADGFDWSGRALSDAEKHLLKCWLPERLKTLPSGAPIFP